MFANEDLNKKFWEAYEKASNLKEKLPPDTMLKLYAYYKQAVKGDNFLFNNEQETSIRNAFKFNAWIQLRGMTEEQAKKEYIDLVKTILKQCKYEKSNHFSS